MKIIWPIEIKENKYTKWYEALIEKAKQRGSVLGYKERHHIVPNCFIKNNSKENLVELTAREHYIAHLLLWKMTMEPKWHNKMTMALNVMVNGSGHKKQDRSYKINSKIYASHRLDYVAYMSEHMSGEGNKFRGKKHSPESLEKMRAWQRDPVIKQQQRERVTGKNNPMYGKKHSEEMKKQIAISTAAAWSEEDKIAKSIWAKEKWQDPEYKKKMIDIRKTSEGWLNRDWKAIGAKAAAGRIANGTDKRSEESKKKISETRKKKLASGEIVPWNKGTAKLKPVYTEEEKLKRKLDGIAKSKATKAAKVANGWVNPNKGKPSSPEAIAKSKATKAAKKAAGIKRKPSTISEETKQLAIEKMKATKAAMRAAGWNPLKGKPKSPESIEKGKATKAAKKALTHQESK